MAEPLWTNHNHELSHHHNTYNNMASLPLNNNHDDEECCSAIEFLRQTDFLKNQEQIFKDGVDCCDHSARGSCCSDENHCDGMEEGHCNGHEVPVNYSNATGKEKQDCETCQLSFSFYQKSVESVQHDVDLGEEEQKQEVQHVPSCSAA